jgi:hypothetical protein
MSSPRRPTRTPGARTRLLLRTGAITGAIIVILWLPAWLSAYNAAVEPTQASPYTWHNEPAIFLANSYSSSVTCTVSTGSADTRAVTLAARSYTTNLAINGVHINRWFTASASVTCDHSGVYLTKGPMLWLYPIGASTLIPAAGIILIAAWWICGRRRRTRPQGR